MLGFELRVPRMKCSKIPRGRRKTAKEDLDSIKARVGSSCGRCLQLMATLRYFHEAARSAASPLPACSSVQISCVAQRGLICPSLLLQEPASCPRHRAGPDLPGECTRSQLTDQALPPCLPATPYPYQSPSQHLWLKSPAAKVMLASIAPAITVAPVPLMLPLEIAALC